MTAETYNDWQAANQRHLVARLAEVRAALERHAARDESPESSEGPPDVAHEEEWTPDAPPALEELCEAFGLSSFERDLLLLCAGLELDASFAPLCAAAQGDVQRTYPTFGLALAALPGGHWSALSPAGALRYWRLVEVDAGRDSLTRAPLRIDERVLHHLAGLSYLDERLRGLVEPVALPDEMPPSHMELTRTVTEFLAGAGGEQTASPVVSLNGADAAGKRAVAAGAAASFGRRLHSMQAADVPQSVAEREALARLWERESVLQASALLVEMNEADATHAVVSFVEGVRGMVFVSARDPVRLRARASFGVEVCKPSAAEQRALWQSALGPLASGLNGHLESLTAHFNLGADAIRAASVQARAAEDDDAAAVGEALWSACRVRGRSRLEDMAQRIEPAATWDDLVLPAYQLRVLREIAAQVRGRGVVYESWGFAARSARGLGVSALFSGTSGTGKTMAAEVLAGALRLDLYRIDLSQVVSKYIGETEKNLRRVFDAAEESGAVLLFDEADALFGKRSEVKDSHDRYANIEVSYLLQRMEAYRGLAILTTNLKTALDTAFMRRLRFLVHFPFPDAAQRAEIWRRVFPPGAPVEGLSCEKLARLSVAGGHIRNIALSAAFLAAEEGAGISMSHILRAARGEYEKMERPLTEAETVGWL